MEMMMIEDSGQAENEAWSILAALLNIDELVDEVALAARESSHGKAAYKILRAAFCDEITTLEARLFTIDARNGKA